MTKKAQYEGNEVEFIRFANPNDPGFDTKATVPLALIRDAEGQKQVVPASDLLLTMDQSEEPERTTVKQSPPKSGKVARRK